MSTTAPTTTPGVAGGGVFPGRGGAPVVVAPAGVGSLSFDVALALFVMVPVPEVTTRISTLAVLPERIVPREHVTVVVPEQDPWLGVADWNVTLAGRTSVKVTPPARPLTVTLSLKLPLASAVRKPKYVCPSP